MSVCVFAFISPPHSEFDDAKSVRLKLEGVNVEWLEKFGALLLGAWQVPKHSNLRLNGDQPARTPFYTSEHHQTYFLSGQTAIRDAAERQFEPILSPLPSHETIEAA